MSAGQPWDSTAAAAPSSRGDHRNRNASAGFLVIFLYPSITVYLDKPTFTRPHDQRVADNVTPLTLMQSSTSTELSDPAPTFSHSPLAMS